VIPRGPSVTVQELHAERRAVVLEMMREESEIGREMLKQDIARLDGLLANLRESP
jgi:hypothetical protein